MNRMERGLMIILLRIFRLPFCFTNYATIGSVIPIFWFFLHLPVAFHLIMNYGDCYVRISLVILVFQSLAILK